MILRNAERVNLSDSLRYDKLAKVQSEDNLPSETYFCLAFVHLSGESQQPAGRICNKTARILDIPASQPHFCSSEDKNQVGTRNYVRISHILKPQDSINKQYCVDLFLKEVAEQADEFTRADGLCKAICRLKHINFREVQDRVIKILWGRVCIDSIIKGG